jgi:hypothetical protein
MDHDDNPSDENQDVEPMYETLGLLQLFRPKEDDSDMADSELSIVDSDCILPSRVLQVMSGVGWTTVERKHILGCEGCLHRIERAIDAFSITSEEAERLKRDLQPEKSDVVADKAPRTVVAKPQQSGRSFWPVPLAAAALVLIALGLYFNSKTPTDSSSGSQVLAQLLSEEQLRDYTPPASRSDKTILLRRGNSYHLSLAHPKPLQWQWLLRMTRSRVDVVAMAKMDEKIEYDFDTEGDWGNEDNRIEIFVLVTANEMPKDWDDPYTLPLSLISETTDSASEELVQVEDAEEKNKRLVEYATKTLNSVFGREKYRALVVWCESENRR